MVPTPEATYELRVRGALSSLAVSVFEEMDLQADTLVSGVIQDQAALHGLLERIRDLGLELVEVHRVTSAQSNLAPPPPPPVRTAKPPEQPPWRQDSDE